MANVPRMCGLRALGFSGVLLSNGRVNGRLYQVKFVNRSIPRQGPYVFYRFFRSFLSMSAVFSSVGRASGGANHVQGAFLFSGLKATQVGVYRVRARVVYNCLRETSNSYAYLLRGRYGVFSGRAIVRSSLVFLLFRLYKRVRGVRSLLQYGVRRFWRVASLWYRYSSSLDMH